MAGKMRNILIFTSVVALLTPIVISDDTIPADKTQIEKWFNDNINPDRPTLDKNLAQAQKNPKIIKVRQDGKGDFKTVNEAIKSIPSGNNIRTIVEISGGTYFEKIHVTQDYVTFYGKNMPTLVHNDDAKTGKSSASSASVTVTGKYFVAANIIFKNSAPRPSPGSKDAQAVALLVSGDKAAFFTCKFIGFQDTLCDHTGRHFYKDCYVEGTVDYVWGAGKSIFLSTELHLINDTANVITAQFRISPDLDEGYSFVHCSVTGDAYGIAYLGRALKPYATVIFSFTDISNVLNPIGWSLLDPNYGRTVFFREYKNTGVIAGRASYSKNLTDSEAKPFLSLSYIEGSKWLLPSPSL